MAAACIKVGVFTLTKMHTEYLPSNHLSHDVIANSQHGIICHIHFVSYCLPALSISLAFSLLHTLSKKFLVFCFYEFPLSVSCMWSVCSGSECFAISPPSLPLSICLLKAASSSSGKDRHRGRGRERGGGDFKMPNRRTTSNPPIAPSPPLPPPPPPRPPLRSRRKSKSPSSRSNHITPKRALDLDKIEHSCDAEDTRPTCRGSLDLRGHHGSELDRKWEGVALELRCRGSRMRSAVYQTSELPSMYKAKRQVEHSEGKGQIDRSKLKATFV